MVQRTGTYSFYGDEAYRAPRNLQLVCYVFVGVNRLFTQEIQKQVDAAKAKAVPTIAPQAWTLHMKDIVDSRWRAQNAAFSHLQQTELRSFLNELSAVINRESHRLYIAAAFGTARRESNLGKLIDRLKRDALGFLFRYIIDDATAQGVSPEFILDSERTLKAVSSNDGWIRDLFEGSQLSLLYPFLAHGIIVPLPTVVVPGSTGLLELADFVAYTISREMFLRIESKPVDHSSANFGGITYLWFESNGNGVFARSNGIPDIFVSDIQKL